MGPPVGCQVVQCCGRGARVVLSISGDRPCTVRIRNFFDAKFARQKPSLLIAYGTLSDDSRIIVLLEVTGLWLEY